MPEVQGVLPICHCGKNGAMERIARISADHRALTCFLIALLSVPPILGLCGYRWLEESRPHWSSPGTRKLLDDAENNFTFAAPVILVLESDDFFQPERIAALRSTVDEIYEIDAVPQVVWIGDIAEYSLTGGKVPLLPEPDASPPEFAAAGLKARSHPLIVENLLSADGGTMLILIDVWGRDWIEEVARVAKDGLEPVGIRTRVTGPLALFQVNDRALSEDHVRIQLMAYTLVAILAVIIFRKPLAIIVAGSGPVVGVFWSIGWMCLLGEARNELAQIILPVMIMMVGFTDGVHLVVCIRQLRADDRSARDAAFEAVKHVGPACFLTSVTTAIGFGSLWLSKSEVIAGFGRASAIGVVATFFALILVTPLLSNSFLGRNIHVSENRDLIGRLMRRLLPVAQQSNRFARTIASIGIALTIGLLIVSLRLVPDDRMSDRVPQHSEEFKAMQHCDRVMGGTRYIRVLVSWEEGQSLADVWPVIKKCEEELRNEELIGKPISIRTCLSVFGENSQDRPLLAPLLPPEFRNRFYQPELRTAQIVARLQDRGLAVYEPVLARVAENCRELEQNHKGFEIQSTSDLILEANIVRDIVTDLMKSLMLAAGVIFVVLGIAFRSLRLALISIVPNVFPLAATGAIRFWINSSLDIASACSFAICLGIAVDDTIHFLNRFRTERARGANVSLANERTFHSVGSALVMTTIVMLSGLGTVVTSQLPTHSNFATMGCCTLAAALVADLVFLPSLLAWFGGRDGEPSANQDNAD